MKIYSKIAISLLGLIYSWGLFAQNDTQQVQQIKPEFAVAEVISVFEGMDDIALLKIVQVDNQNKLGLQKKDEVLGTFLFTTKPTSSDPELPGVKAGDIIRAEISGELKENTGQWDYTVYRYTVLPTKSPSSQAND